MQVHTYDTSSILLVAADRPRRALPGHPAGRPAGRPLRPQARVPGRRGHRRHLGLLRLPDVRTAERVIIVAAVTIGLCFHAFMYAGQPAIMAEMFPTRMRYSGVSLGYQVTSIVAGSLAPLIAVKLLRHYGSWVPIAIYLAARAPSPSSRCCSPRETKGIALRGRRRGRRAQDLAARTTEGCVARMTRPERTHRPGHRRRERHRRGLRPRARRPRREGHGRRRRRRRRRRRSPTRSAARPGRWTFSMSTRWRTCSLDVRHPGQQRRRPERQPDRGVRARRIPVASWP